MNLKFSRSGKMTAEEEAEFLDKLCEIAYATNAPAYGAADRRDMHQGWPSWYTACALPDGRIGAWARGREEDSRSQAYRLAIFQKKKRFYRVADQPKFFDGKEYAAWRIVVVEDGKPLAVSYRTDAPFPTCPHCGRLINGDEVCNCDYARPSEADGWQEGRLLEGAGEARELCRTFGDKWYNPIRR